jgi:hypothetical protein
LCPTARPWTSTTAPAPRIGAGMAYDATLGKLLLFSGVRGDNSCQAASTWILQDSWTWDGTAWAQLHPVRLPPGRFFGALAYEVVRRTTLLFGGGSANSDPMQFDTWTWDGNTWSQVHPAAVPLSEGLMTYDTTSGSCLLVAESTYSWDGRTWIDRHPAHSPKTGIPAFMTYDAARRTAVFVTSDFTGGTTATWTWSGTDWQQQHPLHQPSGYSASGAYDAKRGVVVALIGDQTWTWNGSNTRPEPRMPDTSPAQHTTRRSGR